MLSRYTKKEYFFQELVIWVVSWNVKIKYMEYKKELGEVFVEQVPTTGKLHQVNTWGLRSLIVGGKLTAIYILYAYNIYSCSDFLQIWCLWVIYVDFLDVTCEVWWHEDKKNFKVLREDVSQVTFYWFEKVVL